MPVAPPVPSPRTFGVTNERGRELAAVAAIAAVAFAVRLAWIAYSDFQPTINDDAGRYDLLGRSLAHAGGYINPNGTTTLFWPPGWPFMLAATYKLFDDGVVAALTLNALLGAATVVLVYAVAHRAFDRPTALTAAALYALLPSAVFYAGVTLSETAFTFIAMLAVWLLIEAAAQGRAWPWICAAGVAIGYSALIRGQGALLPLAALPFWARALGAWRPALLRTAITAAIAACVVAPWTIRNYIESGSPVLIATNAGVDFYIGHSNGADGRGRIVNELVYRYPELRGPEAEARVSNDGFGDGIAYAARHPRSEVSLSVRKFFWLYYADHEALLWIDGHGERRVLREPVRLALSGVSDAYYWLVLALTLAGIGAWFSLRNPVRLLLVSLAAYWTLIHIAFFADPRFHAPIMPVLCIWAACGIAAGVRRLTRARRTA